MKHVVLSFLSFYACSAFSPRSEEFSITGRSGGYPKFPQSNDIFSYIMPKSDSDTSPNDCGTRTVRFQPQFRSGKIIGGVDAPYGAFPWQVEIQVFRHEKAEFEHHCGGAVVGKNLILTAAHCLQVGKLDYLRVVIGTHSLEEREIYERSFRIDTFITHPEFRNNGPYANDIAIIKIKSNRNGIAFNSHVRPICLPDPNDELPAGTLCSVTGWGVQRPEDITSLSPTLKVAAVPIIDLKQCRRKDINGGRQQKILDSMLCAGAIEGGVDACQGDSGGPLACEYKDKFVLAGVVSWGDGCGKPSRAGVYTRVSSYISWIEETKAELE